jgi:hypothetical protein
MIPSASATVIADISVDTSPLIGHPAGPFSLEFQLNLGGEDSGSGLLWAVLSNFDFSGGSPAGSPNYVGGATGSLASSVTLFDLSFFNQFIQPFTPGSHLSFHMELAPNGFVVFPDEFTFAILDRTGVEIPTTSPFDVFLQVDLRPGADNSNTPVLAFGSDASQSPAAGGPAINIAPPTVTETPEPNFAPIIGAALIALGLYRRRISR